MTSSASLSICGDVERPARLAPAEPRALMDAELTAASRAVGVGLLLSIKSVDRIEVTRQPQRATAEAIALARLNR